MQVGCGRSHAWLAQGRRRIAISPAQPSACSSDLRLGLAEMALDHVLLPDDVARVPGGDDGRLREGRRETQSGRPRSRSVRQPPWRCSRRGARPRPENDQDLLVDEMPDRRDADLGRRNHSPGNEGPARRNERAAPHRAPTRTKTGLPGFDLRPASGVATPELSSPSKWPRTGPTAPRWPIRQPARPEAASSRRGGTRPRTFLDPAWASLPGVASNWPVSAASPAQARLASCFLN